MVNLLALVTLESVQILTEAFKDLFLLFKINLNTILEAVCLELKKQLLIFMTSLLQACALVVLDRIRNDNKNSPCA